MSGLLDRLGLAARVVFGAMAIILVIAVVLTWFIVHKDRDTFLADHSAVLANGVSRNAERLGRSIEALRRDALVLSHLPPIQGIPRALRNRGKDPKEAVPLEFWTTRLGEIFSSFAESNPEYFQIRYIGVADTGRELVRVDRTKDRVAVAPPGELQSKGDRDYFRETLKLRAGEVYVSEINLNQELGRIQAPHVRTLRAATPVFTPDGDLFGIVVVNMDIGPALDFATTNLPPGTLGYIVNGQGDYLAHPDAGRTFGFDLGRRYTWQRDMPGLQVPSNPGPGQGLQAVSTPEGLLHVAVERVNLNPARPERFVLLAWALPDAVIQTRMADVRNATVAVMLVVALCVGGMVFVLLRRAFAPLTRLTALAENIGAGRYDVALPGQGSGEMGTFVRAFGSMLERIGTREREIKEANATLELSEARLQTVLDNLIEGVAVSDLGGQLLHFNRAALAMHGFASLDEALRHVREFAAIFELSAPDGSAIPLEQWPLARILRGESLRELEVRVRSIRNGGQRLFAYGGTLVRNPDGQPVMGVVTIRDITERRRIEEAARENQARYQTLFNTLIEGFCIIEVLFDADDRPIDYRFLEINSAFEAQTGLRNAQGKTMRELAPDHEEHWFAIYGKIALTGESARFVNEAKALNRWYDVSAYRVGGPDSRKVAILFNDITDLKRAEERVRGQLEHLNLLDHITRAIGERQDLGSIFQVVVRSLEDSLPVDFGCVCLHDAAANALTVASVGVKSEALAHELTMDEQASIAVDANGLSRCLQGQLVYEPDIGKLRFPFPERLARGGLGSVVMAPLRSESRVFGVLVAARRAANAFSSVECEFLRQLSEHVALAAHQAQLYGALQQAYNDLRQTQQAVMQQERLRALGQMASGIAHDINNALSPVSLYTESMLETEPNLSERARGYLETIRRAVEDVAQTVARMREFYRQREVQIELAPVAVNTLIHQVIDLTRARWSDMAQQRGTVIRAETALEPDLPKIMGVESEIREALTNLVFNAVDAMPEGGALTLRTRLVNPGAEGAAVAIEVADQGTGMDEDTRQHCLEPFFTTKGERGTGLGLPMVFGMVQRHSAELEIESASGAGTTVRLIFSVPAAISVDRGERTAALKVPPRLRLLLIDDDPILLKSLQDALETDGHVVTTANGGEAGISAFRASVDRGEIYAAVITDLGMPYVDGRRVAAAVKQISPATPLILLTGWGQRLVAEGEIPPYVDRVLAKPPKLRELREALARLCGPGLPERIA